MKTHQGEWQRQFVLNLPCQRSAKASLRGQGRFRWALIRASQPGKLQAGWLKVLVLCGQLRGPIWLSLVGPKLEGGDKIRGVVD